jgi:hypothetical protein
LQPTAEAAVMRGLCGPELIYRNIGAAVVGNGAEGCGSAIPSNAREKAMTPAAQAFLLTGELFCLSFAAIFVVWFADRLRSNFLGKR